MDTTKYINSYNQMIIQVYFFIYNNFLFIESGVTIIVTPNWMFVATLTGPYTKHQVYAPDLRHVPVYVDPYAYCGILNIQTTIKEWPATAGLHDDTLSPYEILERSS